MQQILHLYVYLNLVILKKYEGICEYSGGPWMPFFTFYENKTVNYKILRKKFGEDVLIKKLEKPKSWLNKKLSGASENQIENLINILEEKSIWQRYGF